MQLFLINFPKQPQKHPSSGKTFVLDCFQESYYLVNKLSKWNVHKTFRWGPGFNIGGVSTALLKKEPISEISFNYVSWAILLVLNIYKSSRPEVFCKKGVLRNFAKFPAKHLRQSLFFNKVVGQAWGLNFIKKETPAQVFSCEFCNIFKNIFSIEHLLTTASAPIDRCFLLRCCWWQKIVIGNYSILYDILYQNRKPLLFPS